MREHTALTARELQVIRLLAEGHTTTEAGKILGITYATARTHAARVRAKINARTVAQAVHILHQEGVL